MRAALRLSWRLRRAERGEAALPGLLAVAGFAVTSAAVLVVLGGLGAFIGRGEAGIGGEYAPLYVGLAQAAAVLLVVPILTLGGVAARLVVARRDARLASLRLAGATSGQVTVVALAEQALQAAVGAVLGSVAYAILLLPLSLLEFQGRRLGLGELWVGPLTLVGVVTGVVVLASVSGVLGLARVLVTPLGVAARTTPARLSLVRVGLVALVVVVWIVGFQAVAQLGVGMMLGFVALIVVGVNVVGPYLVMLAGWIVARLARTPATLLAARRIVDDPNATWRSVSALALGILVAALSSVGGALSAGPQMTPADRTLGIDIGTGALVALAILMVVAATSTGVVQAARVYDQRPQYRALALSGAPTGLLHRARLREVTIPLGVTVALGAAFPVLILLPLSSYIGVGLIVRTVVAIAVACGLLIAAVVASAPLVRTAARVG